MPICHISHVHIFILSALSDCHIFVFWCRKDPGYIKMNIRDSQNLRDDVSCKKMLILFFLVFRSSSLLSINFDDISVISLFVCPVSWKCQYKVQTSVLEFCRFFFMYTVIIFWFYYIYIVALRSIFMLPFFYRQILLLVSYSIDISLLDHFRTYICTNLLIGCGKL